ATSASSKRGRTTRTHSPGPRLERRDKHKTRRDESGAEHGSSLFRSSLGGGEMKRKGYPLLVIGLVAIAALALMSAATSAAPKKSYNVAWFSTKSNRFLSAELASVQKEAK